MGGSFQRGTEKERPVRLVRDTGHGLVVVALVEFALGIGRAVGFLEAKTEQELMLLVKSPIRMTDTYT